MDNQEKRNYFEKIRNYVKDNSKKITLSGLTALVLSGCSQISTREADLMNIDKKSLEVYKTVYPLGKATVIDNPNDGIRYNGELGNVDSNFSTGTIVKHSYREVDNLGSKITKGIDQITSYIEGKKPRAEDPDSSIDRIVGWVIVPYDKPENTSYNCEVYMGKNKKPISWKCYEQVQEDGGGDGGGGSGGGAGGGSGGGGSGGGDGSGGSG